MVAITITIPSPKLLGVNLGMDLSAPVRLSELSELIYDTINDSLGGEIFSVIAEVSNYTGQSAKGFHYFDLVEKEEGSQKIAAKMAVTAWTEAGMRIRLFEKMTGKKFENGLRLLVRVTVQFHSVYGLKLNLVDIDTHFTLSMIEQEKQKILQRLLADYPEFITKSGDGYITANKKLPFPKVISRIAVISSATAAGYGDFEHTLVSNQYNYQFIIDPFFTAMQGETRSGEIFTTLLEIGGRTADYDAVVIVRGGGAQTDLLIFDNYDLGKLVAQFPIPVITGIGHLRDETVVDLMARSVTKSPTEAAKYIIEHNKAFEDHLNYLRQIIIIRSQQLIPYHQHRITRLQSAIITHTNNVLQGHREKIRDCQQQVKSGSRQLIAGKSRLLTQRTGEIASHSKTYISSKDKYLQHLQQLISFANPQKILKRGFAIVYREGKIVQSAGETEPGNTIKIVFSESALEASVTTKQISNGQESKL